MMIEGHWRRLVGYLAADVFDEDTGETHPQQPMGTVFFVNMNSDHLEFGYVVTCRHVLEGARSQVPGKMYILVNRRIEARGKLTVLETVAYPTLYDDWIWNDSADLAVCKFKRERGLDAWLYPMNDAWGRHPQEGQDVFFIGMFHQLANRSSIEAITRSGFVAHRGIQENICVDLNQGHTVNAKVYLVESRSWGGESGSPVFVYEEHNLFFDSDHAPVAHTQTVGHAHLMGIMHGHYEREIDVTSKRKKIGNADVNTGIAIVMPVSELRDLLNDARLVEDRERRTLENEERMRPKPPKPD